MVFLRRKHFSCDMMNEKELAMQKKEGRTLLVEEMECAYVRKKEMCLTGVRKTSIRLQGSVITDKTRP